MTKTPRRKSRSASIDLKDWRGETLARLRQLIHDADPEIEEEWKWRGVPVWSHDGIVCTGESYKQVVKLTFARGAALADPHKLFNSSLEGNTRRAIDVHEGETLDEAAFKALDPRRGGGQCRGSSGTRGEEEAGRASARGSPWPSPASRTYITRTSPA